MAKTPPSPRTFFLNEQHELSRAEKEGGAQPAKFGPIDWAERSGRLSAALRASKDAIQASRDPVRDRHFFLCAVPRAVPKISKSKPEGFDEPTNYAGDQSQVFRRLGLDLLGVTEDGRATVHATTERLERLLSTAASLPKESARERARWVTIDRFEAVPSAYRIDADWLETVSKETPTEVIVELQPLLGRVEVEEILAALVRGLRRERGEAFTGTGADFSGRKWFRGRMRRAALVEIAAQFFSVQSLHPPHSTALAASPGKSRPGTPKGVPPSAPVSVGHLPTVAVLDTGVPAGHAELGPYRRGAYRWPDASAPFAGDHGSFVASRVVFGDLDFGAGEQPRPPGQCQFLDVMVARDSDAIEDKAVLPALEAVVATYPDVRVFNLSFSGKRALASYRGMVAQREHLLPVQDLDNFVFARDVIVVFAAGNSAPGIVPTKPYPRHLDDEAWQLPAWPSGFNTLTCGATAETLHPEGLATTAGAPSPFTRVGPGIAGAPVPEFGAHGGNLASDWSWRASFGVWGCTATGTWEDRSGSSYAAPLLARQAALTLEDLERFCPPGVRPFGVTAKAFLALTAERATLPPAFAALANRTIGHGTASRARLAAPRASSAVFLWQGVIDGPKDVIRVQLPIPLGWLTDATRPELRLVCWWDTPVNEAARDLWASRRVSVRLRPAPGASALRGSQRGGHPSYPMIDRTYDLSKEKIAKLEPPPSESVWDLEIQYDQVAEYYPAITFAPQQRVAFAVELRDAAEGSASPQAAVQALPVSSSMTRLGLAAAPLQVPIILRRTT